MAQVKIYGLRASLEGKRESISRAIHASLMSALRLPKEKRFQRFFPMETENWVMPGDRSGDYILIEILLFSGRSPEAKRALIREIIDQMQCEAHIAPQDVEITLIESPPSHWGIRGKVGDELQLNYRVDV